MFHVQSMQAPSEALHKSPSTITSFSSMRFTLLTSLVFCLTSHAAPTEEHMNVRYDNDPTYIDTGAHLSQDQLNALPQVSAVKGKWFDRLVVAVFENQNYEYAEQTSQFVDMSKRGKLLSQYHGVTHPSQGNYIAMVAGDTLGVKGDAVFNVNERSLVDLLESKGITWASVQEAYPSVDSTTGHRHCFKSDYQTYRRKHNPFISFTSVSRNFTKCMNIISEKDLQQRLNEFEKTQLTNIPQFVFYTPDMNNDGKTMNIDLMQGHDTGIEYAGNYLPSLLKTFDHPAFTQDGLRTVFLVTFDEDSYFMMTEEEQKELGIWHLQLPLDAGSNNRIYTVLWGDGIDKGSVDSTYYSHYSFLATVEANWDLGNLGRKDSTANVFKF